MGLTKFDFGAHQMHIYWRFDHFGKAPYKKLFVCMYVCMYAYNTQF